MELSEVVGTQFAFHGIAVGFVIILAVLVFIFGFRTAEEPPFDKLTNSADDRKPAGKKRKVKDKKLQSNGHATSVGNERTESKQKSNESSVKSVKSKEEKRDVEKSPAKVSSQVKKQQKNETDVSKNALKENKNIKENKNALKPNKKQEQPAGGNDNKRNKGKENVDVQVQNKKNLEKSKSKKIEEKPQDFDEGEWEQASYRKDKKKKALGETDKSVDKKDSPAKKKKVTKALAEPVTENIAPPQLEVKPESTDKKPAKKDAVKKEKPKASEPVEQAVSTPSDAGDSENDSKSAAKKKKKKPAKEGTDGAVATEKTAAIEVVEKTLPKVTAAPPPPQPAAAKKEPEPVTTLEENIAFDELADACPEKWKEPKTSKKSNSRKKVRKE